MKTITGTRKTSSGAAFLFLVAAATVLSGASVARVSRAEGVRALFDLDDPKGGPFPSDRFTVPDPSHNTGLRIALPKPDCTARPSDCEDIDVINELDGFSLLPQVRIPFNGPIDVETVRNDTVFLVSLGDTLPGGDPSGRVAGIDQVVFDAFTNVLAVNSAELLDQHTRHVLIVTDGVRDLAGAPVKPSPAFLRRRPENRGTTEGDAYWKALRNALDAASWGGLAPEHVIAASLFTTQSVTAVLEKIRDQIKAGTPAPADFLLGLGGTRSVFARSAMRTLRYNRQTSALPPPAAPLFTMNVPLAVLDFVPGTVGTFAFGKYASASYRVPGEYVPPIGTRTDTPSVQGTGEVGFLLSLPSTPKPPAGYPVLIFLHGAGTGKLVGGFYMAKLAESGIAVIAIDSPGYSFGPFGTFTVVMTDGTTRTIALGGRGFDQNSDGRIDNGEGFDTIPARNVQGARDGQRQTVVDLMQLVRVIEVGMDADGDSAPDLDPSRIYFFGRSLGGNTGSSFLAVEPDVRAGILCVAGGGGDGRLALGRDGTSLASRVPSLLNGPGITHLEGLPLGPPFFDENKPLSAGAPFSVMLEDGTARVIRSPLLNTVAGALEIQEVLDRQQWAAQSGGVVAFAPYIRRKPLSGASPKPVLILFARGDRNVPNPTTAALIHAGDFSEWTSFARTDLAFPANPNVPNYPHTFSDGSFANPALNGIALQAQQQIASFCASDGTEIIDPDGAGPIFEVPATSPIDTLNYFP